MYTHRNISKFINLYNPCPQTLRWGSETAVTCTTARTARGTKTCFAMNPKSKSPTPHIYIFIYIYTYIYVYIHVYVYIYIRINTYTNIYIYMYIF